MPATDIYSKRNRPPRSPEDPLEYDYLPIELRYQIVHIWNDALGKGGDRGAGTFTSDAFYRWVENTLAREYGRLELTGHKDPYQACVSFLLYEYLHVEQALDIVELTFRAIDSVIRAAPADGIHPSWMRLSADEAIDELNHRFLEHGIGYRYENGQIIRIDSTYSHAEIIKPTLRLLADQRFETAEAEFMAAHKAYRERRYSDCLNECLKAFESTMKIICSERGWSYKQTDTAQPLITAVLDNGLVPKFMQSQLTAVRTTLESGLPPVRNKLGGHGQGTQRVTVDEHFAVFALNTAAANISLLVSAFNALP